MSFLDGRRVKDFYKILGVTRNADDNEIRKAYRRLARRYHPDTQPDDPLAGARFRELTEAYDVLGDPPKRRAYDAVFGEGGGAGSTAGGFEAFLSHLLGTAPAVARKGADLEIETELVLDQVASGAVVTLVLTPPSGQVRRLRVKIPPGVEDGTVVRLPREGDPGDFGGPPGDLMVRVRVAQHPVFRRERANLYADLPISVFTAVLGGPVNCPSLEGDFVFEIPAGTQGNSVFRFNGRGLPHTKGEARGHLEVRILLQIPLPIDSVQRGLWETLAQDSASAFVSAGE
ncbi:MAG: J domain-containing protein [Candidatus Sericytochromatia bacterium]|nr:J domain-containing protein [Candidatus Sericytochromatia bacterium]